MHLVPFIYYSCVTDEGNFVTNIAYLILLQHILTDHLHSS